MHITNTLILLFVLLAPCVSAQDWRQMVAEGRNYHGIVEAADAYYSNRSRGKGSGYKQYMRWKHEMRARTYPTGEIRNFNAQAIRALRRTRTGQMRSVHGEWEELGPFDYSSSSADGQGGIGRVNRIAFHPTDPDEFWVGAAAGGLWKTTNNGSSWSTIQDGMPQLGVSGIVYDHTNPDIMYALTGDGDALNVSSIGVLKSVDGGTTWLPTGLSWGINSSIYGRKMMMHPVNPNKLYVATRFFNFFQTVDSGETWTTLYPSGVSDFEFCPSDTATMYAVTESNPPLFLKTTNSGISWDTITNPMFPDTASRAAIAICPSADSVVYLMFGGGPDDMDGFFRSSDYGATFTLMSSSPNILGWDLDGNEAGNQATRNMTMIVNPSNADVIYVGGINCWKSTDQGVTWKRKSYYQRDHQPYVHADFMDMQYKDGVLYVCNDGGVYRTSNGGDNWHELSAGLSIMQFYEINIYAGEYTGGTQDNGTNGASVGDLSTHQNLGGDGFGTVIHYGNTSIQYLTSQSSVQRRQFGSNIDITPSGLGENDFWWSEVEMHTTNPDYVFITSGRELYKGNGDPFTFTWDSMRTSIAFDSTDGITAFAQGTDNQHVMYVANGEDLIRSDNINASNPTWTAITGLPSGWLEDIEVDPDNASHVWVTLINNSSTNKVFFSPDAGATWVNQTGSLPNVAMHCLVYHSGTDDGLFIGTDIGVYYRNNGIGDWIYFSNGLPPVIIKDLDISGGYLYAGTYGRGLWRTDLYSVCPTVLSLTPANDPSDPVSTGLQIYHAQDTLTSTRIVSGGIGSEARYHAGTNVTLLPGFKVTRGNRLVARIEGCPE